MAQLWGHTYTIGYFAGDGVYPLVQPAIGNQIAYYWSTDGDGNTGTVVARTGNASTGTLSIRTDYYDTSGTLPAPVDPAWAGTQPISDNTSLAWSALSNSLAEVRSDVSTNSLKLSYGNHTNNVFLCGWWRPYPLTNGRVLFQLGDLSAEWFSFYALKLRTKGGAGEWTATVPDPLGGWLFFAFYFNGQTSGPTANWRVWYGTETQAPTEMTVAPVTTPTSALTASSTLYLGNSSAANVNFRGEIGPIWMIGEKATDTSLLTMGSTGTISNNEAQSFLGNVVMPFWLNSNIPSSTSSTMEARIIPNDGSPASVVARSPDDFSSAVVSVSSIGGPVASGTATGATSFNPPRSAQSADWPYASSSPTSTVQRGL